MTAAFLTYNNTVEPKLFGSQKTWNVDYLDFDYPDSTDKKGIFNSQ